MRLSLGPFVAASSLFKSRRTLALVMLAVVFEALWVLGRAAGPIEFRTAANAAVVLIERPKGRTA